MPQGHSDQGPARRPTNVRHRNLASRRDATVFHRLETISSREELSTVDVLVPIPVRNDARAIGCWVAGLPTDARSEEAGGGWRVAVRMPCPPSPPTRLPASCAKLTGPLAGDALESGRDREPRLEALRAGLARRAQDQ